MAYQAGQESDPAHHATQVVPRMPFSSPMGEEVLSPTSPRIPHYPSQRRRKNTADGIAKGAGQSRSRKLPIPKSPKRRTSREQEKDHNKLRWPGLNVVTSFSKSPVFAASGFDAGLQNHRRIPPQTLNAQPGFVALSDIKVPTNNKGDRAFKAHNRNKGPSGIVKSDLELRKRTEAERNQGDSATSGTEGLGVQPIENPPAPDPRTSVHRQSGEDCLKPSPTKLTELSPSDGPIVIGISVPSAKLAEHAISPDVGPTPVTTATYNADQFFPETPTIVVTPARYQGSWHFPLDDSNLTGRGRPRPSSSFYSQTLEPGEYTAENEGRPSQSASSDGRFHSKNVISAKAAENIDGIVGRERPESTCTVFDEDDNPVTHKERPYSGESRLRILNRSSLDTIATKHRSQGWWNYIVSPFLSRSNTTSFGGWAGRAASPIPALPSSGQGETPRSQQLSSHSPVTPASNLDSEKGEKDRTSIWADLRRLEAERLKIGFSFDQTSEVSSPLDRPRSREKSHGSNAPQSFEGCGAALEYFNACRHDQNSPNPYFECQNHVCIPFAHDDPFPAEESRRQFGTSAPHDKPMGKDIGAAIYQVKQEPADRFSVAFSQANTSRHRALSEATEIEDDDVTPVVREAHIAPVVRAGPPIAAASIPVLVSEPKEAAPRSAQGSDLASHVATVSVSVPAKSSITFPPSAEALPDTAPAANSADASDGLQASSLEHRPKFSPDPAEGVTSQVPANFSSRSDTSPERFIAANPPRQVYPNHAPLLFSEPNPSTSKKGAGPQQTAQEKGTPSENFNVPAQNTYIVNHYYDRSSPSNQREKVTSYDTGTPPITATTNWERREKIKHHPREGKAPNQAKPRGCFKRGKRPMTKKKKRLLWGIAASLVLIVILIVALAMTLTRKGDNLEVQSQWLNVTGFPPIPTGISTIVQPDIVREDSGCIQPATVWSCALPKEEQESIAPNNPNQPNFRVEIRFRNGTSTNSTLTGAKGREKRLVRSGSSAVSAGSLVRRRHLRIRDTLQDSLFSPSPSPPSEEDQEFLGKTTDNNTAPFEGEETPFFMSFIPASKLPVRRLMKRQGKQGKNNTDPFPNITQAIPPPDTDSDGTAAAANLLPLPVAQPLRLFNRGLATEHYGFYTYFDRSIFLKSTSLLNETGPAIGDIPADRDGGAEKSAATVRCTWRQTRFLVQIWTNSGAAAPLLGSSNVTSTKSKQRDDPKNLTSSSANNFVRPGSFPYPVSITLDRHGGALDKKFIFCYGLDNRGRVVLEKKKIQLEDRAFGGQLVNPVLAFKSIKVGKNEGGPGGIDGGSGGCSCQWRNWGGAFGANGGGVVG